MMGRCGQWGLFRVYLNGSVIVEADDPEQAENQVRSWLAMLGEEAEIVDMEIAVGLITPQLREDLLRRSKVDGR